MLERDIAEVKVHPFDEQVRRDDVHILVIDRVDGGVIPDAFQQIGLDVFQVFGQMFDQPKLTKAGDGRVFSLLIFEHPAKIADVQR